MTRVILAPFELLMLTPVVLRDLGSLRPLLFVNKHPLVSIRGLCMHIVMVMLSLDITLRLYQLILIVINNSRAIVM